MRWVSWQEAFAGTIVGALVWLFTRRTLDTHLRSVGAAGKEFAFVAGLYTIWRLARMLPLVHEDGALERARDIAQLQEWLYFPSERAIQEWTMGYPALASATVWYYGMVHVPALLVFLVWMYLWRRDHYWRWRSVLCWTTAGCLWIRFIRVAPPRFLPEYGFVDLSQRVGFDVYGPVGTGVSDQYAAMPSIHVAWAAIVAFGVVAAVDSWWRWVVWAHLPITLFVVAATGHHWWMDGVVAGLLIAGSWIFDRWWRSRRSTRSIPEESVDEPFPVATPV